MNDREYLGLGRDNLLRLLQEGKNYAQIGRVAGRSRERVRQVVNQLRAEGRRRLKAGALTGGARLC